MKAEHPISKLCEHMLVSASGFYDWERRHTSPGLRAAEDLLLAREIASIHADSRQTYGTPRVEAVLRSRGRCHGRKRIARLMAQQGVRGRQKGRYHVQTTDSNHDHPIAPNRLAVAPKPSAPNQTCIDTQGGLLYLAGILDLFSRRIVGWAMSDSIDSALVLDALSMALLHRNPPADLLFHSDRGVQYAAGNFRDALARAHLVPSMSRRGNCYDNAFMESFWSSLKLDLAYRRDFATRREARAEIFDYIEVFYNRQRLHTALGCLSPSAFELAALESTPARRRSPMGVEPMRDGAQRTHGHGAQRATGAPLGGDAATLAQDPPSSTPANTLSAPQTHR